MAKIKMQHRNFKIGERVFICDYHDRDNGFEFGVISKINGKSENAKINSNDIVRVVVGDKIVETSGVSVYKIAPRISKKCGETICYEHNIFERGHNYPFYVPNNDENYYKFEIAAMADVNSGYKDPYHCDEGADKQYCAAHKNDND